MKPYVHAKNSAHRHGGTPEDYQEIHDFIDSPKSSLCDVRSRAVLHNAWGIYLTERVFGVTLTNSDGKVVSVRTIAEEHVHDDLGFIPTLEHWFKNMSIQEWMNNHQKQVKKKVLRFTNVTED